MELFKHQKQAITQFNRHSHQLHLVFRQKETEEMNKQPLFHQLSPQIMEQHQQFQIVSKHLMKAKHIEMIGFS